MEPDEKVYILDLFTRNLRLDDKEEEDLIRERMKEPLIFDIYMNNLGLGDAGEYDDKKLKSIN